MEQDSRPPRVAPHGGFASLRRKIVGWTSNLLAVALVLVAALGLGRQLTGWWGVRDEATTNEPYSADAVRPSDSPPELTWRFGDEDRGLVQETFAGTRDELAIKQLDQCRQTLESASSAPAKSTSHESAWLARWKDRPPLEEVPGKWRIYGFDGLMPLVAGVQSAPATASSHNPAGEQLVAAGDRVLVWSLAVPQGENRWTLHCFRAAAAGNGAKTGNATPLPAGVRRTLSLASSLETTSAIAGFGEPGDWAQRFDAWSASGGWQAESWRVETGRWTNRFVRGEGVAVVVQFQATGDGKIEGLLVEKHPASRNQKDGR